MSQKCAQRRRTGWLLLLVGLHLVNHGLAHAESRIGSADNDVVAATLERQDFGTAAVLLRQRADANPGDPELRFALARALAWSGDYTAALVEYDRLRATHPDNADYGFGCAQTLAWSGRSAEALKVLAEIRSLAPDYEDVWRLEHTLLERRDDPRLATLREQAAQRFPHATWWRPATRGHSDAPSRLSFTAGAAHESLSSSAPDWDSRFVHLVRRTDTRGFHASLSEEQRFGASDTVLAGGMDWRLNERWRMGFELGLGSDADFMPRRSGGSWVERSLPHAFEAQLRVRHRDYGAREVTLSGATLAKYVGNWRLAYGLDRAELAQAPASLSHSATLGYYGSARVQFTFNAVQGREAETVAPGEVLRVDVRGASAGGKLALSDRWTLAWWLGSIRQGDFYRRRHVGLSLTAEL